MNEVAVQPGPTGLQKLAGIKNIVEGWCTLSALNVLPLSPHACKAHAAGDHGVMHAESAAWAVAGIRSAGLCLDTYPTTRAWRQGT